MVPMEVSAFRRTVGELGAQLRGAEVDREAFDRGMRRCDLSVCRATCCHDGVVVGTEEMEEVAAVLAERGGELVGDAWDLPERLFETDGRRWKTATRLASDHELAEDFPRHFARTRCVFLDDRHRCVLQRISVSAGKHPWHWKPVSCWMHPLVLKPESAGSPALLTVLAPEQDVERFASCTHCGRAEPGGEKAAVVLAAELEMLRAISGRDFGIDSI